MGVDVEDLKLIADKLSSDFEFYKGKSIFVTGGTGFFGKWLLEAFIHLNQNHGLNSSITILSRSPSKFKDSFPHLYNHNYFNFVQGDVRDFPDIAQDFDLIIHAAADASSEVYRSNPELMRSTIMDGTKNVCEFAEKVNCKRILYTSSGAAYGPQPDSLAHMAETFVDNPLFNQNDAYASAKLESETYFKDNAICEVVVARCFAFTGPYLTLDGGYAFGNFISNVMNKESILIKSSGESTRSYLYSADLVVWLLRILSKGKNRDMYNVGSDEKLTILELAERISLGKVGILSDGVKGLNVSKYIPSIEKSKKELSLDVYTSLKDSIEKTIDFYRKN
ncbi:NAD-dependent epimerase/dehydratase family protein [Vibrio genomosp. F10 str. 9ZC157]|uniref:dTDP-glucose 4,6-dehydratase n=1 Tax=Vibrio genomosp. F10 str. ZF-129 TaxID=1187848 RepID=A0A1E5BDA3_9VIBR|nr:NAD(P)-dependent oxidoreductase [Vibrio genomosp. F10]OEE33113.1 dTDP-glucose 4,6-dehydratase [Vibrio genomosp. F10 str. ZF-129]OEE95614.1 dTDP-glucose 4,6-dehydratase [Vibrio genomosp. F10 str. 9ZC157]